MKTAKSSERASRARTYNVRLARFSQEYVLLTRARFCGEALRALLVQRSSAQRFS